MTTPEPVLPPPEAPMAHTFRSLKDLVDYVSGKTLPPVEADEGGKAESLPFPFMAIVGQNEMKLALLLGLINPNLGGVLLVGPRGTAKTTAVRSLLDLLPQVERSLCYYGCLPEDIAAGGIDAVCPECAQKFAEGKPLTAPDRVRLIELPLNARIEDVVGGIDERAVVQHERLRIRRGILAQADRNLLYIDEINLLPDEITDAILDAAAAGSYTVRRGPVSATYRARFVLIGSMNPEEGRLRPQILDRFGLRIIVKGLQNPEERLEAYRRVQMYMASPRAMISQFMDEMNAASVEIQSARERLKDVKISNEVARDAIAMIQAMQIDSLRTEITWFEAGRAYAAADARTEVTLDDLKQVAPMCLRLRRSAFMNEYFNSQQTEEAEMSEMLAAFGKKPENNEESS